MDKAAPSVKTANWMDQVQVRHLRQEDLPGLEWDGEYAHFRRLFADAWQRMEHGLAVHWVAELPGSGIIGQVFIQLTCDRPELADGVHRAYLFSFRIRPAYRNQGLGTLILNIIEDDLRKRKFQAVTLNVAKENKAAQRLYQKHGYLITAHEPGVWSFPDQDGIWHQMVEPAWRMEKKLR
jgi:ribosomal protein S18 acetylase RimI-like enzyme